MARRGSSRENSIIANVAPPTGKFIQKHHLQVNLSVKTPPKSGPTTDAMPYIDPMTLVYIGRCRSGTVSAIIIKAPEYIPAQPAPAMARPIIKASEVGAAAHTSDPSVKMATADRNTHLTEYKLYNLPN